MSDTNWLAIRSEYEAGGMSLRQLAAKYNVSKTYLIERRNKEGWNRPDRPTTVRPLDIQKVPNRDANAATRVAIAINLRAKKFTYDEIAKECGYGSASACRKAIQRELQRVVVERVDELRREESYMLDRIHGRLYEAAMNPTNKDWQWAADRVMILSKARRELMGLDTPTDTAINPNLVVIREVPQGLLPEPTP